MTFDVQTEFLIAGAGPAGASLAAFLGQHGLMGLVIAKDSSTAYTPRAHAVNPFALECLRDIDLEDEALRLAIRGPTCLSFRISRDFKGEEYGRVRAYEEKPETVPRVRTLTPSEYIDLPQRYLEPLLCRYSSHHDFNIRFSTELVAIEHVTKNGKPDGIICTARDLILGTTFKIRTKYLFGADGGRSTVARSLDFQFISKPGGMQACNVLIRADLGQYVRKEQQAALNWFVKPDRTTFPGLVGHLRPVRPWNEWVLAGFGPGGTNPFEGMTMDSPELVACVRELVGDDTIDVEILSIDPWTVRETVAEEYANATSDVFILGDAAHRHPPTYGLGSNTCVQDAYNLAWKVAYVSKGLAGPSLLKTFSPERQPVGAILVKESNVQIRANELMWSALGMRDASAEEGTKHLAELREASEAGSARRKQLSEALELKRQEFEAIGLAYNQWYTSDAVCLDDEKDPRPTLEGDWIVETQVSTYPGSRLPHAWVDHPKRKKLVSTQDLAGKASFSLFTGVGGDAWRDAAKKIQEKTGIPVRVHGIGFGLDYNDIHRDWQKVRGVDEGGCVLVRPDRFVAWRSNSMVADTEIKLRGVLDKVLSRNELAPQSYASRQRSRRLLLAVREVGE
ncbi:FAD-binding domain-containing protein 26 [Elsinoe fawcettii]|nr:FAD-binding domain-containing protein 26 [Elsinoe fawcettii]